MSKHDFDRAVDFLQGALNAASFSTDKKSVSDAAEASGPRPTQENFPGFEPPAADVPPEPAPATAEPEVAPVAPDPFTPPPEAIAPPLPGMADPSPEDPPPVIHLKAEKACLQLRPPAKRRAALAEQASHGTASRRPAFRVSTTVALSALSAALGIGLIVACACLACSSAAPAMAPSDGVPLALLPETADAALWETVSKMSGEIDGVHLAFERGMATDANGNAYKLLLDFCRSGSDIYAKVSGDRTYVVRVDEQGKITKAYPAPKNNKPLKDIFGR